MPDALRRKISFYGIADCSRGGRGLALTLLFASLVAAQEPVGPVPPRERAVSPEVAARLAASLPKYEASKAVEKKPGATHPLLNISVGGEPVVVMTPFVVADTQANPGSVLLAAKLQREKDRVAAEAFNWRDGGTLLERGPLALKLKYNSEHKGFDLLNLKW